MPRDLALRWLTADEVARIAEIDRSEHIDLTYTVQAGELVELPESTSKKAEAGDLISIVVGIEHITVNEIEITKLENGLLQKKDFHRRKERIKPLYKELTGRYQQLIDDGAQPGSDDEDDKLPVILVQADRRLPYTTLKYVMRTCGQAGFNRFRFAAKEAI